ncbi:hypothetical protein DEU56DRAFT_834633, partial [Suillus clintonianus]|uniref:uncharacterized protein n=1 Tax=Suillus clintonianus TaxID=1904413 RepID=UPI001B873D53
MPLVAATGNYTPFRHTQFIQVDTTANIIPLTFNYMSAEVRDPTRIYKSVRLTLEKTPSPPSYSKIQVLLNFLYIASNDSDPT